MSKKLRKYLYKSTYMLVLIIATTPMLSSCQHKENPIPLQPSPAKPDSSPTPKVQNEMH